MEQTIKVSKNGHNWAQGVYATRNSVLDHKVNLSDLTFMIGKSRRFEVCDFWGGSEYTTFTIKEITEDNYYLYIKVKASSRCPDRFYPSISQILGEEECKNNDWIFPISYQRI